MKIRLTTILALLGLIFLSCNKKNQTGKIVLQSTDYVFVGDYTLGLEGPAVSSNGDLYFVNPKKNGTIGIVSAKTKNFNIYIDSLPNGGVANGIRFGTKGEMFLADYVSHRILSVNTKTKEVSTFAMDTSMNQPNDIAISSQGILFASDPNWADETGNIWKIDTTGKISLLESDMGTTNGIEVAPGDSILYVNESVQRKIWAYDLSKDGNVSNKRLLIEFADFGLDGMRCDVKGNLYIARYGKGVVAMVSVQGVLIREIELKGQKPTNVAFGGKDGKTVYVTCQDRGFIEMFEVEIEGRSWRLNPGSI